MDVWEEGGIRPGRSVRASNRDRQETYTLQLADAMVAGQRQLLQELREVYQRIPVAVERAEDLLKSARLAAEKIRSIQPSVEVAVEHARFQTILDSAPHGIIFVDAATGYIRANPAAIRLIGKTPKPEAGLAQFESMLFKPDGQPLTLETLPLTRALVGKTVPDKELLLSRPDGTQIPVLASAAPVRGPQGKIVGAVILFQDITTRKELERMRAEWTSVIAHDMRQPIAVIKGHVQLLRHLAQQRGFTARELKALDHIQSATDNLNRIVDDLLDVSRLEARRLKLDRRPVNIVDLVHDVVERVEAVTRGHPVAIDVEEPIPTVMVDPGRIEQVLGNLLSNAAKYSYVETIIQVRIRRAGDFVQLSVINRGQGIPRKEIPYLFARFHRVGRVKGAEIPGVGLGLYITRGLVEAHGGRIWVESIPGETTTFSLTLPIAK